MEDGGTGLTAQVQGVFTGTGYGISVPQIQRAE